MSPRYKCIDCGFVWTDVEAKEIKTKFFIRCQRCESRNIIFPKNLKTSSKLMIWLMIFCITGVIGAGIGVWIHLEFLSYWGEPWIFGLIGFLIGFIGLPIIYCMEEF